VGLELGIADLGIGHDPPRPRERFSLWVYADDCHAAVERLRSAGVKIVEESPDQPWGEQVTRVLDPDGTEVSVGERT
jgi:lactoylglutathione lyase